MRRTHGCGKRVALGVYAFNICRVEDCCQVHEGIASLYSCFVRFEIGRVERLIAVPLARWYVAGWRSVETDDGVAIRQSLYADLSSYVPCGAYDCDLEMSGSG